jgi:hypothetical protein
MKFGMHIKPHKAMTMAESWYPAKSQRKEFPVPALSFS